MQNGTLVLGIEARNIEHFKAGHPMHIGGAEIGGFGNVTELLIVYGDTLRDVYDQLNEACGDQLPPFVEPQRKHNG